ncbi:retention module-containing protein, partial [Neiella marina]
MNDQLSTIDVTQAVDVTAVQGQALILLPNGDQLPVRPGEPIPSDASLTLEPGATIQLKTADGRLIQLQGPLSAALASLATPDADSAEINTDLSGLIANDDEETLADIEAIQQALLEGADPTVDLPAAAAGAGQSGGLNPPENIARTANEQEISSGLDTEIPDVVAPTLLDFSDGNPEESEQTNPTISIDGAEVNYDESTSVVISGVATDIEEGAVLDVVLTDADGNTVTGAGVVAEDGSFVIVISDIDDLNEGPVTVTVTGTNEAGDSASASDDVVYDLLPTVTINAATPGEDTTPTFSGTSSNTEGNLTLTVNGIDYAVTPDSDGNWEFTLPDDAALEDGEYTATITGSDAQGNDAPEDAVEFEVDQLPTVSINAATLGEDTTPTFSGTSTNTEGNLTLTVNGIDYAVTPDSDGNWEFTLPDDAALEDGEYTATITGSDAQGNDAPEDAVEFEVDQLPTVSINAATPGEDTTPTFSGTSTNTEGNLTLTVNGVDYAVTPDSDGNWEFTLPDDAALEDGEYTATITGSDAQGNDAPEDAVEFEVDQLPTVSINAATPGEDTTPTFSGTSSNTEGNLTLTVNGIDYAVTPDSDGNWEFTLPDDAALDDGEYTATITGSDAQGNDAPEDAVEFEVDQLPTVSINAATPGEDTTPTFSGTSSNTEGNLTLTVNGIDYAITPDSDGNWEFTLPDDAALEDGEYTATITGSDAQGNDAPDASTNFEVDQLPTVSINAATPGEDTTPTFSGMSSNTEGNLTLTVNGIDYAVTPDSDGNWEFTLPDDAALEDGEYTATITGSDAQGNDAPDASTNFEVDQLPTVSINAATPGEDTTPTFSGTSANTEGNLTLTVNGIDYAVTPDSAGNWEFTLPDDAALEDGEYTATITGSDAQGNDAPDASTNFEVDQLPTVSINAATPGEDTTPTFSGTSSNTEGNLTLTVNGIDYAITPDSDGNWEFTLPDDAALEDGEYTATITGSDAQGNDAPDASTNFEVDQLPTVSINAATPGEDTTPTFSGTSANTEGNLTLTVNGIDYAVTPDSAGNWEFTLPDDAALEDGEYTATITGSDAQGNDAPEDTTGFVVNSSPPVDDTAPSAPTVQITEDADNDGEISDAELSGTVGVTVTLPDDAVAGDTLTVTGQTPITLTSSHISDGELTFEYDAPAAGDTITVEATVTDQADNESAAGSDSALVVEAPVVTPPVDDTAPSAPTVQITEDANNDGEISDAELNGTVGVTVTLPDDAVAGDTLTVTGQTPITLTSSHISDGELTFEYDAPAAGDTITVEATVTDQADNESAAGSDSALLVEAPVVTPPVDDTAPSAPTVVITEDADNDGEISDAELSGTVGVTVTLPDDAVAGDTLTVTGQTPITLT